MQLAEFARVCAEIGDEAADDSGFVSLRRLLQRFKADIQFRPLLVEGMLAKVERDGDLGQKDYSWTVLIDSEMHNVSVSALDHEQEGKPLGSRLRNTVAHELAHSLAFRYSEFGIRLQVFKGSKTDPEFVQTIERETERLSPLLLVPDKTLHAFVEARLHDESLNANDLVALRKRMGVSREVLISRFSMLARTDRHGLRGWPPLRNLAIGIGEWDTASEPVLRSWPLFREFDGGITPKPLLDLPQSDRLPIRSIISLDGKPMANLRFKSPAGLRTAPDASSMEVELQCEHVSPRKGARFLFVLRNTAKSMFLKGHEARQLGCG